MTEWIISSSVLILVVCLGRAILKGKISLRLQYALWGIVLVRLLVPVNFFDSAISVMNFIRPAQESQVEENSENIRDRIPGIDYNNTVLSGVNKYESPSISGYEAQTQIQTQTMQESGSQEVKLSGSQGLKDTAASDMNISHGAEIVPEDVSGPLSDMQSTKTGATMDRGIITEQVLLAMWIGGMAAMCVCLIAANVRFSSNLYRSRKKMEVSDSPVQVYVSGAVETPCLSGLLRPSIYLTRDVAEDEHTRGHVLAHEITHYKHRDYVWSVLRGVCLVLHWYNPLVWIAAKLSRQDAELACDEGALKRIGEEKRIDYGKTLVALTCREHLGSLMIGATTMTGGKKAVKERVVMLMKKPKTAFVTAVAVMLIGTMLVGCTFTGSQESAKETESTVESVAEQTTDDEVEETQEDETEQSLTEETEQAVSDESEIIYKEIEEYEGILMEFPESTLDEETLSELTALFSRGAEEGDHSPDSNYWYAQALTSFYSTPEHMDLNAFFTEGVSNSEVTQEELDYLTEEYANGVIDNAKRITSEELKEILMTYFVLPIEKVDVDDLWFIYYEPTDVYLDDDGFSYYDSPYYDISDVDIVGGRRLENGYVELYYMNGDMKCIVTMYMQDGIWRIHSNRPGFVGDPTEPQIDAEWVLNGAIVSLNAELLCSWDAVEGKIITFSEGPWKWDLDRDGAEESITFSVEYDPGNSDGEYTLQVNDKSETSYGDAISGNIYIASLNQENYQLLVYEGGLSDDYVVTVWTWDGTELKEAGYMLSHIDDVRVEDGRIYCKEESHIFQTSQVDMIYELKDNELVEIPQELYEMGNTVTALRDIPTYSEKGGGTEDGPVLKEGSKVLVVGTDNHSWVKLQDVASGEYGWMQMAEDGWDMKVQGEEIDCEDLFSGLRRAG